MFDSPFISHIKSQFNVRKINMNMYPMMELKKLLISLKYNALISSISKIINNQNYTG